jgi:hypothetical protein
MDDITVARKLVSIEDSAKKRGVHFNLSFKRCKQLLITKRCYYTGKPFDYKINIRTFDRVDNSKGYVDDNVVACTKSFNEIKKNLTVDEITLLFKKVTNHINKKSC